MKKIFILALLLILTVGYVSAVDLDGFQLPDGFTKDSTNLASDGDFSLSVASYDKNLDYDLLFKDDGGYTVTVGKISRYVDEDVEQVGALEVVEINGEQVLIEIYSEDMSKLDDCCDKMEKFNDLNGLEPISV